MSAVDQWSLTLLIHSLESLKKFKQEGSALRKNIKALEKKHIINVSQKGLIDEAESLCEIWRTDLSTKLSKKIIPTADIEKMNEYISSLFKLCRPNNRVSSYLKFITSILKGFDNTYIHPYMVAPESNSPTYLINMPSEMANI